MTELEFSGEIWQWRGPAPYYFVSVPDEECLELHALSSDLSYGWGCIRVDALIGDTGWETSLMPKDGGYVLPLKDVVRAAEEVDDGDVVTVRLTPKPPRARPDRRPQPRTEPAVVGPRSREPITDDQLTILPADEAGWEHLEAIFGTGGDPSLCWCQRFKMWPGESWASVGPEELATRLRTQTGCDDPESTTTSGLVAYVDGEPIGWCAVEPRTVYRRLLLKNRVPWEGRTEDKTDDSVWAVTCFVTRAGFRRRGISRALARTAVDYARQRGARALEGYPDLVESGYVGSRSAFADAGFVEVSRPTNRRAVMRIDFD